MDVAHDVGPRERQHVAVVAQVLRVVLEPLAAVIFLGQAEPLQHRAHRTVENADALREDAGQFLPAGVGDRLHASIVGRLLTSKEERSRKSLRDSTAGAPRAFLHYGWFL